MKGRACILAALVAVPSCAGAPWTPEQKWAELAIAGTFLVDSRQTQQTACEPGRWECNPVLGLHPSPQFINGYFIGALALHALAVEVMPDSWRRPFQAGTLGLELGVIAHNFSIGLNVRF